MLTEVEAKVLQEQITANEARQKILWIELIQLTAKHQLMCEQYATGWIGG